MFLDVMNLSSTVVNISMTVFLIIGLSIFILFNRQVDGTTNRYFIAYIIVVCLLLIFDGWEDYLNEGYTDLNNWRYFTTAMCYTLRAVAITIINFLIYPNTKNRFYFWIPPIILALLTFTNQYTHWVCYFSYDNFWFGGPLRYIPHIISGTCFLFLIIRTILNIKTVKAETGVLFGFIVFIIVFSTFIETIMEVRYLLTGTMMVAGVLYYSIVNKENEAKRIIAHEQELSNSKIAIMLSQIQPHFLYNALNTIEYLCETKPEEASVAVRKFSKFLRTNMNSLTEKHPIPLEQELKHLENYLYLEKLRFPKIETQYCIECKHISLPALSLQPLVENAIKHAFKNKMSKGNIRISSWEDERNYYVCVEDDGDGFIVEQLPTDNLNHIGIENTRKRLKNICNASLTIESSIGIGSKLTITVPKEDEK